MKKIALGFLVVFIAACQSKTNQIETSKIDTLASNEEVAKKAAIAPQGNIYRCDGFHNGIASEWIQVSYDENGEVNGMWFWDTNNENKKSLDIVKQEFQDGEISATTGTLRFPNVSGDYKFVIIEDRFGLTDENDVYQEFDHESTE